MTDPLLCIEVLLLADQREAHEEAVESAIWDAGALGMERQDETTFSALVEEPNPRPHGSVRWRVYMEVPDDPAAVAAHYAEQVGDAADVSHWVLEDMSFLTNWRDFFKPTQISPRFMVHPPWEVPDVGPEVVLIQIEPGMAFGTGTHETTRLCLNAIDRLIPPGTSPTFFDVGCGSGVLSIGAAKIGAKSVAGMDKDPIAVDASIENAEINGVTATFDGLPIEEDRGTYELVVANILPHILIDICKPVIALVAPKGTLVLSGIVTDQLDRVTAAYVAEGMKTLRQDQDGDWWSVEMSAP